MSHHYKMYVEIEGWNRDREDAIVEAAGQEWPRILENRTIEDNVMYGASEANLGGGESEKEFALRLARAIWNANEAYCKVVVECFYLEDLPYQRYTFDKKDCVLDHPWVSPRGDEKDG